MAPTTGASPAVVVDTSTGSVGGYIWPPDSDPTGTWIVYREIAFGTGWRTLHSARADGSQPAMTLADPGAGNTVGAAHVTPDGLRVLFTANPVANMEVFAIPIDGSAPALKLNAPLVAGGSATEVLATPDSARVVYRAHQDVWGRFELYGARIDGSGPVVKLNGTPVQSGDVEEFTITPDGARVVYRADQVVDDWSSTALRSLAEGPRRA